MILVCVSISSNFSIHVCKDVDFIFIGQQSSQMTCVGIRKNMLRSYAEWNTKGKVFLSRMLRPWTASTFEVENAKPDISPESLE